MKTEISRFFGYIVAAALLCVPASCERAADESGSPDVSGSRVGLRSGIMPLDGGSTTSTPPAEALNPKTGTAFTEGDEIGFFSDGGNTTWQNDGSQGFSNFPMTYDGKTFVSDEFKMDVGRLGYFLAYYPYEEGIETEKGVSAYSDKEGTKGRDFLCTYESYTNSQFYTSGGNFHHMFAVVRIKLGKGFTNFQGDILIQMKQKVKNVRIDWPGRDSKDSPFTAVKLINYEDEEHLKKENRRLPTFRNTDKGIAVWDAIVPCRPIWWRNAEDATAGGVTVEAVVLKAGDGTENAIPVDNYACFLGMVGNNFVHGVRGSYIYTLEVRKEGFDAAVFPCNVAPWNNGEITETLPVGIADVGNYQTFVKTCNELFKESETYSSEQISEKLKGSSDMRNFGTEVTGADGSTRFTVFLTADLDFSGTDYDKPGQSAARIDHLAIPFDGRGHTISNLRMQKGFCGKLSGTLKNLRFDNFTVIQPETETGNIGMLADRMETGSTIEGCEVSYGRIEGNAGAKVGAAVGTMNGGTMRNCTFDGYMYGASDGDTKNLVGETNGSGTVTDDNKNNMVKGN